MNPVKSIFICLFFCALVQGKVNAQGFYDGPFRFGQNSIYGSVKSMGMGGVQMSTGADATAQATNPASPALMRRSEIQFSLMPTVNRAENTYLGGMVEASKSRAPIGSFSLALSSPKDEIEPGAFRGGTFTMSYNRLAVFDRNSNWEGKMPLVPKPGDTVRNSIIDYYDRNLNTNELTPNNVIGNSAYPDLNLFYDTYVLDVNPEDSLFTSFIPRGDVLKKGAWNQSLSQGIWNFGYSANFNDNIYIGASFGYFASTMNLNLNYQESLSNVAGNPRDPNFLYFQGFRGSDFNIQKSITQTMSGITGNIGILSKINDNLRLSSAIQFPMLLSGKEVYNASMTANYNNINYWYNDYLSPDNRFKLGAESSSMLTPNEYNWKLRIPAKYRIGATYIAGKKGMVGIDLEYTDLSKSRLTEGDGNNNFKEENAIVNSNYRSTLNVKIGGEYRIEDLRIRAGYAFIPSPIGASAQYRNNVHGNAHYFTGGMGGRYETWYWDAALVYGLWNTSYNYLPDDETIMTDVKSEVTTTQLRLGLGFYF